jgi:hypothetical protein
MNKNTQSQDAVVTADTSVTAYARLMDDYIRLLQDTDNYQAGENETLEILDFPFHFQRVSRMNTESMLITCRIAPLGKGKEDIVSRIVDENLSRHFRGEALLAIFPGSDYLSMIYNVSVAKVYSAAELDMIVQRMATGARAWEYIISEEFAR